MDGPQDRYQWTRQRHRLVYTLFRGAFEHVGPCWAPATRPGHVGFICRAFGDMPSVILSRPSSRSALRSNSVQLMSLGPRTPMSAPFSNSVNTISFPTSLWLYSPRNDEHLDARGICARYAITADTSGRHTFQWPN